ncbi:MAG TPA: hypothetical protein VMD92_10850 [Acidobacteriaceae bacterium]|jgi:hypothetical protein|nr:hypothetical protein [Acidobacteriaceae bacterium]
MEKPPILIENWSVVESVSASEWCALEPGRRLTGYVYTHAELPRGLIYTSAIVRIDEASGLVETRNNLYQLGHRNDEYEHWLRAKDHPRAA